MQQQLRGCLAVQKWRVQSFEIGMDMREQSKINDSEANSYFYKRVLNASTEQDSVFDQGLAVLACIFAALQNMLERC